MKRKGPSFEGYVVREISHALAQQFVVKYHYLHRKASCSYSFGLFDAVRRLIGVVIYGTPANKNITVVCGPEERANVIELTRLWVDDAAQRNCESFLVGRSLQMVPKEIVISYADTAFGHVGLIYQATNWLYTGVSETLKYSVTGMAGSHSRSVISNKGNLWKAAVKGELSTLTGKVKLEGAVARLGDRVKRYVSKKHRYVYFNTTNKRRKRELRAKLRYPVLPYPKCEELPHYPHGSVSVRKALF